MTGSKSIFCIILPILFLFKTQAEPQIFPSGDVTYWTPGSLVELPWTYNYTNSEISSLQWDFTKSGSSTARRLAAFFIEAGNAKPKIDDPMFNITGQATLEFKNANLIHNGTYTFRVTPRTGNIKESKILVIILEQPTAVIKCSPSSLIVEEGENITCLCSATGGNPPATVSWSKNGMVINGTGYLKKNLSLKNISKEDSGSYNCTIRSHNLTDTKLINIKLRVKCFFKDAPFFIFFTNNMLNNTAQVGDNVKLTCVAAGYPEPSYKITFVKNQTFEDVLTSIEGILIITNVNIGDAGTYRCLAKNNFGSIVEELVLNVKEDKQSTRTASTVVLASSTVMARSSMTSSVPPTATEKSISDKNNGGTEWYIVVITLFCGLGIGIVFSFTVMWLYRRRKEKRDHPIKPSETRGGLETHDNPSVYQELDLQRMSKEDNYQSLRKTSRPVNRQEPTAEVESSYQELDKVKGSNDDNNYQSLNRV